MQVEGTPVGAPGVVHPGWCDPRRCGEADGDVEHHSEPVSLRFSDAYVELAWVRRDGADAEDQGVTELRIDISYSDPLANTQLFLTPREAHQFGVRLLDCCWQEHCARASARWDAPVVTP
jgi:hypothetical protein